jgi:DNA-binding beta-propeller fold protein YncE
MTLHLKAHVGLPPYTAGEFDHADIHPLTGRVFVANTRTHRIDIIDGNTLEYVQRVPGCLQPSGVLYAPRSGKC